MIKSLICQLFLIACCLFVFSGQTQAYEVTDLYQFETDIQSKTRAERRQATKLSFKQVLQKVSGQTALFNQYPALQNELQRASNYLIRYQYFNEDLGQLMIRTFFDEEKVHALLSDYQIPIWSKRRPLSVLWLAVEDGVSRQLLTAEAYPELEQIIFSQAKNRGLPLVLPLLDLDDRIHVSVTDVWGNFSQPLETASHRYDAEKVISARLFFSEELNNWQLEWRFIDDNSFEFNLIQGDQQQSVAQLVEQVAEQLAERYAIDPTNSNAQSGIDLVVTGIGNYQQIELARRKLESFTAVKQVWIKQVTFNQVVYKVAVIGQKKDLTRAIELDSSFEHNYDPLSGYDKQSVNEYSWLGE